MRDNWNSDDDHAGKLFNRKIQISKGIGGWVSIDTVDRHLDWYSVDTRITLNQHPSWHSIDTQSTVGLQLGECRVSQLLTYRQLRCRLNVDQDANQGYHSTLNQPHPLWRVTCKDMHSSCLVEYSTISNAFWSTVFQWSSYITLAPYVCNACKELE